MSENQLRLLELGGSPYDIGYIHGKEGKEEIKEFLNVIVNHGIETNPDLTKERVLSQTKLYVPFIEAYSPHLAKEIHGIADGAEISLGDAYLLQLRAEFTQLSVEEKLGGDGCTSFVVNRNMTEVGEILVGQNLDLNSFYKDFGVMLHVIPNKGPVILCYSQIGSLALAGINSAGIGLAINALFSSGWRPGVPRTILYRLILEKESVYESGKAIKDATRASSCNYLISHKSGEITDIETTPEHYAVMNDQKGFIVHTNHFLYPDLIKFETISDDKMASSQFRESRFRQLITKYQGKLSAEKVKGPLTDHKRDHRAICAHADGNPSNIVTIASIIALPADGIMYVSLGQGCRNKYMRYAL